MAIWWPSANTVPDREGFKRSGKFPLDRLRRTAKPMLVTYSNEFTLCSRCSVRDNSWIYIYYLNPGWVSSATLYWSKNTVLGQSSTLIPPEQWPHYSAANNPTVKREKVN